MAFYVQLNLSELCSCLNLFRSSCNFKLFPISQSSRDHLCPLIAEKIEQRPLSIAEQVFSFLQTTLPGSSLLSLCLLIFDWLFACVPDMHHESRWTCTLEFSFRKTFWVCRLLCRCLKNENALHQIVMWFHNNNKIFFYLSFCAAWFNGSKTSSHGKTHLSLELHKNQGENICHHPESQ